MIESNNPSEGIIFSDGVENDHLDFNSGSVASVTVADQKTSLVMFVNDAV